MASTARQYGVLTPDADRREPNAGKPHMCGVDGDGTVAQTSAAVASAAVELAVTASACLAGGGVRSAAPESPSTLAHGEFGRVPKLERRVLDTEILHHV